MSATARGVVTTGSAPARRVAAARVAVDVSRFVPAPRSIVLAVALVAGVLGAYAAARTTGLFAVETISVRGAPSDVGGKVRRALAPYRHANLVELDGGTVVRRLTALPYVATATYDRDFPHTLRVRVTPERPLAVLRRGSQSWLLSARSRVMQPLPRGARAGLPRVWTHRDVTIRVGGFVAEPGVRRAVAALTAVDPRSFSPRIRTVALERGGITFVLASGLEVELGNRRDLALKLAVAGRIVPLLSRAERGGGYLDVRFPERPVSGVRGKAEVEVDTSR